MLPDISIIVPMYNVEKFLPRCVESIRNQTHRNIEIILVDDESPDNCGAMADEYAKEDSRIKVIHQKNKWLGGARNSGLKIATGDYILFVDSDDYIRLDMCEKLLDILNQYDCDMVIFDLYNVNVKGEIVAVSSAPIEPMVHFKGDDIKNILFPLIIGSHSINSAWMKVYKRDIFSKNDLMFNEKIRYAEDYEFCLRLFPCINTFMHYNEPLYYYIENSTSIMHTTDSEMIKKFVDLHIYREQFLETNGLATTLHEIASAELLITMVVKSLNRYLGDVNVGEMHKKVCQIQEMTSNAVVQEALSRIDVRNLQFGISGKAIVLSMRYHLNFIIYLIYRLLY